MSEYEDDFDDALALKMLEEVEAEYYQETQAQFQASKPPQSGPVPRVNRETKKQQTLFKALGLKEPPKKIIHVESEESDTLDALELPHKRDPEAIKTWVYPLNKPVREYQQKIAKNCLFYNTLVALPTGLGKTLIAAVVIYNYLRWYPESKVIFMAPTRPLVSQQIEACQQITGISPLVMQELTGSTVAAKRKHEWIEKRVFFLTPQVLKNDLRNGICPAKSISLLIADEAHRATGNHAYCEVVREMAQKRAIYRMIALTATPGNDSSATQKVIDNLGIETIEIRTEQSPDIVPYTHEKTTEKVVVDASREILHIQARYADLITPYVDRLRKSKFIDVRDIKTLHPFQVIQAREAFRRSAGNMQPLFKGTIEGDFALLITLLQPLTYLMQHGIVNFHNCLKEMLEKFGTEHSKSKVAIAKDGKFKRLLEDIDKMMKQPQFSSHPKIDRLVSIILSHFAEANGAETKVIVFTQYRESVDEIVSLLSLHSPMLKVSSFIGQSSSKKGKGLKQSEQISIIQDFHQGKFNCLVSTSIGEEGLDVGSVDLIVCFDSTASPVRMLQRIGRTGRKREGRIVLLLTKGKEEESYEKSLRQYKNVQKVISRDQFSFGKRVRSLKRKTVKLEEKMLDIVHDEYRLLKDKKVPLERGKSRKKKSKKDETEQTEEPTLARRSVIQVLSDDDDMLDISNDEGDFFEKIIRKKRRATSSSIAPLDSLASKPGTPPSSVKRHRNESYDSEMLLLSDEDFEIKPFVNKPVIQSALVEGGSLSKEDHMSFGNDDFVIISDSIQEIDQDKLNAQDLVQVPLAATSSEKSTGAEEVAHPLAEDIKEQNPCDMDNFWEMDEPFFFKKFKPSEDIDFIERAWSNSSVEPPGPQETRGNSFRSLDVSQDEFDQLDSGDIPWDQIDIDGMMLEAGENNTPLAQGDINSKVDPSDQLKAEKSVIDSSFVVKPRKVASRTNRIVDSSPRTDLTNDRSEHQKSSKSAFKEFSSPLFKTPIKRNIEARRLDSSLPPSNRKKRAKKVLVRPGDRLAKTWFEMEAELSDEDAATFPDSEEEDDDDRDLTGLIASENEENDQDIDNSQMKQVYLRSLFSQCEGFGERAPAGRYKLVYGKRTPKEKRSTELLSSDLRIEEDDEDPGSLLDFIDDDEEV